MNFPKEFTMLLQFLLGVTFAAANEAQIECNTCVKVDALCYNISHLLDFQARFRETVVITKLEILRKKNVLYYAFEPNITDPEYYKVGYVNLDDPTTQGTLYGMTAVTNFKTFHIDQDGDKIYLGGGDGIYISNNGDNATSFSSRGDTIQNIFFKKNIFFVRFGEFTLIEKEGEEFRPHEEFKNIKNFVIDKNNVIVYLNTNGLHATKIGTNETVYLSKNGFFRGLTMDLDGIVYAWWIDGIYRVIIDSELKDSKVVKVADIPTIGAITFDNDNYLTFSSEKGLYRLVETNTTLC